VGPSGSTYHYLALGAPDLSTPPIPGAVSLNHQTSLGGVRRGGELFSLTPDLVLVRARPTAGLVVFVSHMLDVPYLSRARCLAGLPALVCVEGGWGFRERPASLSARHLWPGL